MSAGPFPSYASSRAVLVGTGSYVSRDLKAIPHSARNIRGLADVLTDRALGGFAARDVRLVDDPGKAQDIMAPVAAAAREAQDVLLVYYSGHGLLTAGGALHLSLTESEPGQDWTSLPFSYLAGIVKQSPASVRIVVLDACYSGRAHADLMGAESRLVTDQLAAFQGIYSLTSAPEDRTSKAPPGATYSAFTGFLLDTVRKGLSGAGPVLSLSEVYEEVRRRMWAEGLNLPQDCGKTGAGTFPFVRNRLDHPPEPVPDPDPDPGPLPVAAAVPRARTADGKLHFTTVKGGGYRMDEVNARLAEVRATAADPERWSQAAPPYFRTESRRKFHGFDVAEVNAHVEEHRHRPATFEDALRLVLLLQGCTLVRDGGPRLTWAANSLRKRYGMAEEERLVGRTANSLARAVAFSDTHLYVVDAPRALRVPYVRLQELSLSVSSRVERVVTVTDLAGSSEDVPTFTTVYAFGHHRLEVTEGEGHPLLTAVRAFLPAMADLRARHPEWFPRLTR
ncbi:caspase family protein [Streptomyces sp. NPDC029216]|uniref:caspase family protein n=1 Tax=Streptomyces sp. NPDC029216 TaxID=3154701 RepID=UPI0033D6B98B